MKRTLQLTEVGKFCWSMCWFALLLAATGCSKKESSARIEFKDAIAPPETFSTGTRSGYVDSLVKDALSGKAVSPTPGEIYTFGYQQPDVTAGLRYFDSAGEAKDYCSKAFASLRASKSPSAPVRDGIDIGAEAIGQWKDDEKGIKGITFRFGNVVIALTSTGNSVSVAGLKEFAEKYAAYLATKA